MNKLTFTNNWGALKWYLDGEPVNLGSIQSLNVRWPDGSLTTEIPMIYKRKETVEHNFTAISDSLRILYTYRGICSSVKIDEKIVVVESVQLKE